MQLVYSTAPADRQLLNLVLFLIIILFNIDPLFFTLIYGFIQINTKTLYVPFFKGVTS